MVNVDTYTEAHIMIELGTDWGCDYTEEEADRYVELLSTRLAAAFPGALLDVSQNTDAAHGTTRCWGVDGRDVDDVCHAAWDAFCARDFAAAESEVA